MEPCPFPATNSAVLRTACPARCARLQTLSATTANPFPASPARAASTAQLAPEDWFETRLDAIAKEIAPENRLRLSVGDGAIRLGAGLGVAPLGIVTPRRE